MNDRLNPIIIAQAKTARHHRDIKAVMESSINSVMSSEPDYNVLGNLSNSYMNRVHFDKSLSVNRIDNIINYNIKRTVPP